MGLTTRSRPENQGGTGAVMRYGDGDRAEVRIRSLETALRLMRDQLVGAPAA